MKGDEGLSFTPTPGQAAALAAIQRFLQDPRANVFILRGYAGTGKTTLISRIASMLAKRQKRVVLMAPTGRAARVLGTYCAMPASTIHSHIFDFFRFTVEATGASKYRYEFVLKKNAEPPAAVYIVDEASMISDHSSTNETLRFGSGHLLSDLVTYIWGFRGANHDCKLIVVGDPAQLPPVYCSESPALEPSYWTEHFGYVPHVAELTEVTRREADNPISALATSLRESLRLKDYSHFLVEPVGESIRCCEALDIDQWVAMLKDRGNDHCVLLTHSNVQAFHYNRAIRERLFPQRVAIGPGDRIVIMQNTTVNGITWLNGDVLEVTESSAAPEVVNIPLKVKKETEPRRVPLRFRSVIARSVFDERVFQGLLLENLLESPLRDLTELEERALFVYFRIRFPKVKVESAEFPLRLAKDPFFNALRVKYAYAVTCHKAQGGEWPCVAVDFNTSHADTLCAEFYRYACPTAAYCHPSARPYAGCGAPARLSAASSTPKPVCCSSGIIV